MINFIRKQIGFGESSTSSNPGSLSQKNSRNEVLSSSISKIEIFEGLVLSRIKVIEKEKKLFSATLSSSLKNARSNKSSLRRWLDDCQHEIKKRGLLDFPDDFSIVNNGDHLTLFSSYYKGALVIEVAVFFKEQGDTPNSYPLDDWSRSPTNQFLITIRRNNRNWEKLFETDSPESDVQRILQELAFFSSFPEMEDAKAELQQYSSNRWVSKQALYMLLEFAALAFLVNLGSSKEITDADPYTVPTVFFTLAALVHWFSSLRHLKIDTDRGVHGDNQKGGKMGLMVVVGLPVIYLIILGGIILLLDRDAISQAWVLAIISWFVLRLFNKNWEYSRRV